MGWLAERLDAVEEVLAAPESQSKPAELEDSGLFMDGDGEDEELDGILVNRDGLGVGADVNDVFGSEEKSSVKDENEEVFISGDIPQNGEHDILWEEGTTLGETDAGEEGEGAPIAAEVENGRAAHSIAKVNKRSHSATDDVVAQIAEATAVLKLRFEEVKHLNHLMLEKLDAANDENLALRNANDKLTLDLHLDYSELLFLKIQLQTIENHAVPFDDQDPDFSFVNAIDRLELDWRDVEKRFSSRMEAHKGIKPADQFHQTFPEELRMMLRQLGPNRSDTQTPNPPLGQLNPSHILDVLSPFPSRPSSRNQLRLERETKMPAAAASVQPHHEPTTATEQPIITAEEPIKTVGDPTMTSEDQTTTAEDPTIALEEPTMVADELTIAVEDSTTTAEKQEMIAEEPVIVSTGSNFWNDLANAVGIIDYFDLFNEEEED